MNVKLDLEMFLCYKGRAISNFLKSLSGIDKEADLSNIETKCIVDYTHLLFDKIHFKQNWSLGFQLEKLQYYLYDTTNLQNIDKDFLSKAIPVQTSDFLWQIYFLTNAHKILEENNEYIGNYFDLNCFFQPDYVDTINWQPNVNEAISPKIFWNKDNTYAKVECCWYEEYESNNYSPTYGWCRGLYLDSCEYEIQDGSIRLVNHDEQQLIPSWIYDEDLPL